jgi:CheY-like chemotaxis protein
LDDTIYALSGKTTKESTMDILVIDDNMLMQQVIARFLGDMGYSVGVASRVDEGLNMARRSPPALALIDMRLPDMDGQDALHALRALPDCEALPAVAISGIAELDVRPLLKSGFNEYLAKPIELDTLEVTVRRYLHGS